MTRIVFLSIFVFVVTVIVQPAYAVVEMYNVELNCPVDSFDFSGVLVEADYLELCEVSGIVLDTVVDNFYQSGSNYPQITLQINENQQNIPVVTLREQLDGLFDKQRADLIVELNSFLQKNISLKSKLVDVEHELSELIITLKEKILLLKEQISKGSSNVNLDDIITESDLDKIARDFLSKQSIQFAYGDMFVFQDRLDELAKLAKEKTDVELQNSLLEQKIIDGEKIKSNLLEEQIGIDGKLEKFKDTFENKVEKIKENTNNFVKGIKDLFK